jgi:hypothetical protein
MILVLEFREAKDNDVAEFMILVSELVDKSATFRFWIGGQYWEVV